MMSLWNVESHKTHVVLFDSADIQSNEWYISSINRLDNTETTRLLCDHRFYEIHHDVDDHKQVQISSFQSRSVCIDIFVHQHHQHSI